MPATVTFCGNLVLKQNVCEESINVLHQGVTFVKYQLKFFFFLQESSVLFMFTYSVSCSYVYLQCNLPRFCVTCGGTY